MDLYLYCLYSPNYWRDVYNRLISHINDNKLLCEYQFGFQKGKSTYLAIMMLVDKIMEALDQGESVVGVFLDFSKAFDTVDHNILLKKMNMEYVVLNWNGLKIICQIECNT